MPGSFYTDPELFVWECDTVLQKGWHCLGRADELSEVGDFFTQQVLNEPLLITLTNEGISVLSNACRHRGMPLAQGSGNTKRHVCPYHAWAYAPDGQLLSAPRMKNGGFDAKTCALPSFESRVHNGFIYASLSENPVPFDMGELDALIGSYEPENFRHIHTASEIWNCNWKALVENFMEGYHLSVVHPETLHHYTPTGLSRKGPSGPTFTSYFANYPDTAAGRGNGAMGLSDVERKRSTLFAFYPCQVVSIAATTLVSLSIFPLAPEQIEVRWTFSTFGKELDDGILTDRIAVWNEVNREDREKLETMQKALHSRHATGGPLAGENYEGTVRDFQKWIALKSAESISI
jgi:phenylpropionate dioxygenase-like ring-hydroxylating dioxygenase large terminal subunit